MTRRRGAAHSSEKEPVSEAHTPPTTGKASEVSSGLSLCHRCPELPTSDQRLPMEGDDRPVSGARSGMHSIPAAEGPKAASTLLGRKAFSFEFNLCVCVGFLCREPLIHQMGTRDIHLIYGLLSAFLLLYFLSPNTFVFVAKKKSYKTM